MFRLLVCFFVLTLPIAANASVASTSYVDGSVASQVRTSGDQNIAGVKTYKDSPVVPTPDLPADDADDDVADEKGSLST